MIAWGQGSLLHLPDLFDIWADILQKIITPRAHARMRSEG